MTLLRSRSPRRAFSAFELVLILALLGLLFGLLVPGIGRARDSANRANCQSNLRQIGIACHNYDTAFAGNLPYISNAPAGTRTYGHPIVSYPNSTTEGYIPSLFVQIMPYMEQDNVYNTYQQSKLPKAFEQVVKAWVCPSDPTATAAIKNDKIGWKSVSIGKDWQVASITNNTNVPMAGANYRGNPLVFNLPNQPNIGRTFADGTSNTVLWGEYLQNCPNSDGVLTAWADSSGPMLPNVIGKTKGVTFQTAADAQTCYKAVAMPAMMAAHPSIVNVVMADGSVRSVPKSYDGQQLYYALTPSDGDPWDQGF